MAKFVSYSSLSFFLSKLKTIFSDINHVHDDLEQAIADLSTSTQYNIVPITQDEYDALTSIDENTLYIIEV